MVAPLTLVASVLAIALLPIAHGILVPPSIGTETVIVYLDPVAISPDQHRHYHESQKEAHTASTAMSDSGTKDSTTGKYPLQLRSGKAPRPCLNEDSRRTMREATSLYAENLRQRLFNRRVEGDSFVQAQEQLEAALRDLTESVIKADCADTMREFWELRPPPGLVAQEPELRSDFTRAFLDAAAAYPELRFGTILTYPRDEEPLALIEPIRMRGADHGGQWSITAIPRNAIAEVVVLPGGQQQAEQLVERALGILTKDRENTEALGQFMARLSPHSLDATIRLLEEPLLSAPLRGGLLTATGGMAYALVPERPDLTARAIDLIANIAAARDSPAWPCKTDGIRGAAVTALHLTRSVYAGYRLAQLIRQEEQRQQQADDPYFRSDQPACPGEHRPLTGEIPQTSTAAGFLLADLLDEVGQLTGQLQGDYQVLNPTHTLREQAQILIDYLLDCGADPLLAMDDRRSACAGLEVAGLGSIEPEFAGRFLELLRGLERTKQYLSLAACVGAMSSLGMDAVHQRKFLHDLVLREPDRDKAPDPVVQFAQESAMQTLYRMGISGESEFLFEVYTGTHDHRLALAASFLEDGDAVRLARLLRDCVTDRAQDVDQDVVHRCAHGLLLLDEDYRGDLPEVEAMIGLRDDFSDANLISTACLVLHEFGLRGNNWSQLELLDAARQQQCSGSEKLIEGLAQRERWNFYVQTVPGMTGPTTDIPSQTIPPLDFPSPTPKLTPEDKPIPPDLTPEPKPEGSRGSMTIDSLQDEQELAEIAASLTDVFIQGDAQTAAEAALYLEDVPAMRVVPHLRRCLDDIPEAATRLSCLMGLLLVARDYGGEPELIQRLSDIAGDPAHPDLHPIACLALGEYAVRGNTDARSAMASVGRELDSDQEPLNLEPEERWTIYNLMLREHLAGIEGDRT